MQHWFFTTVPKRVWSLKAKLVVTLAFVSGFYGLWLMRGIFFERVVTPYLVAEPIDSLPKCAQLVVENWTGDYETFLYAKRFAILTGAKTIVSTVYPDLYENTRRRQSMLLNAWAAELDTTTLIFFIAPMQEPKTLNLAKAVIDSVQARGWREFGLVTFDMHSARSKKCYEKFARPLGISVRLLLYERDFNRRNWFQSLTGLTVAFPELIKQLYYDLFIL